MKKTKKDKILTTDIFPEYTLENILKSLDETRLSEKEKIIDEKLAELEEMLDRKLSENEAMEILEIVDEYTPKDKKGNYLVDLLPFDYAWEVYKARRLNIFD
jgi:hypothetical protein